MAAGTVVVNFNIFEHGMAHLFTSGKAFAVDGFYLHGVKETFSTGIIDTVRGTEIQARRIFPFDWEPRSEEYACITISDSGSGIDPKHLDNIFDPFFSTRFTGRGLGLPVVLGLLRTSNGAIGVESYLGRGSDFKAYFPLSNLVNSLQTTEKAPVDVS